MSDELDFRRAARRVLFDESVIQDSIPGAGRSAAEGAERHIKVKVTMNLDGDVIGYFKERARAEGRAYQSLINQVLREYVEGERPEQLARKVCDLLVDDPAFLSKLREKLVETE